jgi:hypothetical protein
MKRLLLASGLVAVAGLPAFAGNIEPVAVQPMVTAPMVMPMESAPRWTGGYVGASIGFAGLDLAVSDD